MKTETAPNKRFRTYTVQDPVHLRLPPQYTDIKPLSLDSSSAAHVTPVGEGVIYPCVQQRKNREKTGQADDTQTGMLPPAILKEHQTGLMPYKKHPHS